MGLIALVTLIGVGCTSALTAAQPSPTAEPPTATAVPPTATTAPTATPEPTATEVSKVITAENIGDMESVKVIKASDDQEVAVDFQPGTHTLAAFGFDKLVRLFDADSGDAVRTMAGHGDFGLGMGYSPD